MTAHILAWMNHHRVSQDLREELQQRRAQHTSLQLLWSQLQPEEAPEDGRETREKIRVTGSKLKLLLRQVDGGLGALQQRLVSGETDGCLFSAEMQSQPAPVCHQGRTPSLDHRSCKDASPEVPESTKVSWAPGRSELIRILSDLLVLLVSSDPSRLRVGCAGRAAPPLLTRSRTGCSALLFRCASSCCCSCCSPA